LGVSAGLRLSDVSVGLRLSGVSAGLRPSGFGPPLPASEIAERQVGGGVVVAFVVQPGLLGTLRLDPAVLALTVAILAHRGTLLCLMVCFGGVGLFSVPSLFQIFEGGLQALLN